MTRFRGERVDVAEQRHAREETALAHDRAQLAGERADVIGEAARVDLENVQAGVTRERGQRGALARRGHAGEHDERIAANRGLERHSGRIGERELAARHGPSRTQKRGCGRTRVGIEQRDREHALGRAHAAPCPRCGRGIGVLDEPEAHQVAFEPELVNRASRLLGICDRDERALRDLGAARERL
ncbi:MAG TPA: hypothetical protein VGL61_13605 [Kofleriaceae bacterium]